MSAPFVSDWFCAGGELDAMSSRGGSDASMELSLLLNGGSFDAFVRLLLLSECQDETALSTPRLPSDSRSQPVPRGIRISVHPHGLGGDGVPLPLGSPPGDSDCEAVFY